MPECDCVARLDHFGLNGSGHTSVPCHHTIVYRPTLALRARLGIDFAAVRRAVRRGAERAAIALVAHHTISTVPSVAKSASHAMSDIVFRSSIELPPQKQCREPFDPRRSSVQYRWIWYPCPAFCECSPRLHAKRQRAGSRPSSAKNVNEPPHS
jgi:hypothetical protein